MLLKIFIHAHSGLRWLVLALLIAAILNAFKGWKGASVYTDKDKKVHLFAMILLHIQILTGFVLYYMNFGGKVDFGAMSDPIRRFFTVEHSFMMLLAMVLITIGFSRSKKAATDVARFKLVFMTYLIGLLLILAGIPWPFRNLGVSGWF